MLPVIAETTSFAFTDIVLPFSIQIGFFNATFCGLLSKTLNTKIKKNKTKDSQELCEKFYILYFKSKTDEIVDIIELDELVDVFE